MAGARRNRHALVYAPSGTGKSSCLVIPTLLRWQGSVLAFDIKGELWEKTAGYRQSCKEVAIRFDRTLKQGSASYNPLLAIQSPRRTWCSRSSRSLPARR